MIREEGVLVAMYLEVYDRDIYCRLPSMMTMPRLSCFSHI